ncbi:hypothetical protein GQ600_5390 [Phytophthora cactorum]|nr:hypothetical protein GQ600_5390 [Phytophthora cactorum]
MMRRWQAAYLGQEACAARDEETLVRVDLLHVTSDAFCELDGASDTSSKPLRVRFQWLENGHAATRFPFDVQHEPAPEEHTSLSPCFVSSNY